MRKKSERCQWHWVSELNRKEPSCTDLAVHLYKKTGLVFKAGKATMYTESVFHLCDFHNVLLPMVTN